MKVKLSGFVYYANGTPKSSVIVRILDKDASGEQDDDLTLTPGFTDEQGRFNLTYEPLRYLDYHTFDSSGIPGEAFNIASSVSGRQMPDLGDSYLPYMQFNYTYNDKNRVHTAPMRIFQTKFYLPENPPLEFLPSMHGFKFQNRFSGYFLPFSPPAFLGSGKVTRTYGLCGGMCAAAYDYSIAGRTIPQMNNVPHQGTRLQRYLFQRQMDSFGGMGRQLVKVAQWTSLPDDTPVGVSLRTAQELASIQQKLDDKNPVILAVIYENASSVKELSQRIFNNHQVLAFACQKLDSGGIQINIYDPNLPCKDEVIIRAEPVLLGESISGTMLGVQSSQWVGGSFYKPVRGFFGMPYLPVQPPPGI